MTLRIPILASARALARSSSTILTGYSTCNLVTASWTRRQRSHSTFSSDHRQFKILMSLPNDKVVHSSIPLRPPPTYALPPKPTFTTTFPSSGRDRSPGARARAHSPVNRSWREVDIYRARSRSPPRRDYDTYNARSSSSSWNRRDTDSYDAHSPPPRESDKYIPRSPRRAETDRYIPDRSLSPSSPRRTDTYIPTDSKNPLRTWTDSYRPDKLGSRKEYSTSRSRSPDKPTQKRGQDYRRNRSRSSSSVRDQPRGETSRGTKNFGLRSPRSGKRDRDQSPEPSTYVHPAFHMTWS
jgi:hypothetical protein